MFTYQEHNQSILLVVSMRVGILPWAMYQEDLQPASFPFPASSSDGTCASILVRNCRAPACGDWEMDQLLWIE